MILEIIKWVHIAITLVIRWVGGVARVPCSCVVVATGHPPEL